MIPGRLINAAWTSNAAGLDPGADQAIDAWTAGKDRVKNSGTLNENGGALLLKQVGIAHEVQHVPEALLGVKKDRFTVQRTAIPAWLRKVPLWKLPALPAPFELREPFPPFAQAQPKQSSVLVKERIGRLELDRSFMFRQRIREISLVRECQREVVVRSGIVVDKGERAPEAGNRVLKAPAPAQSISLVSECGGKLRIKTYRFLKMGQGSVELVKLRQRDADGVLQLWRAGPQSARVLQRGQSICRPASLDEGFPEMVVRLHEIGV